METQNKTERVPTSSTGRIEELRKLAEQMPWIENQKARDHFNKMYRIIMYPRI